MIEIVWKWCFANKNIIKTYVCEKYAIAEINVDMTEITW